MTAATPEPASLALPRSVATGASNHAPAPGESIDNAGGDVSGTAAGGGAGGLGGAAGAGRIGPPPAGGGTARARQRLRARRSAFSFLACFFTYARRALRERCERKNARLRTAILRLNVFSRFVCAWQRLAGVTAAESAIRADALPPPAPRAISKTSPFAKATLTSRRYPV